MPLEHVIMKVLLFFIFLIISKHSYASNLKYIFKYQSFTSYNDTAQLCNKMKGLVIRKNCNKRLYNFSNSNIDTLNILIVECRYRPIILPEGLSNKYIYDISIEGKIKNDTLISKIPGVKALLYTGPLRKYLLSMDSLNFFYNVTHSHNIYLLGDKKNSNLEYLYIRKAKFSIRKKSFDLDSTLLFFENLNSIGFTFNPLIKNNYEIYSQLKYLEKIAVYDVNFRKQKIDLEILKKANQYRIIFYNCKFNADQKKILSQYNNLEFQRDGF